MLSLHLRSDRPGTKFKSVTEVPNVLEVRARVEVLNRRHVYFQPQRGLCAKLVIRTFQAT